jgi:predicted enzyme related to lactoylglutathione lyase
MAQHGAFIWYELMTTDVAGAKAFYGEVVGWTIAGEGMTMPDGSEYRMIHRSDGGFAGGVLTISPEMAAHGTRPTWMGYIHHPDVDGAAKAITEAGGTVHMPPMDMEGVGRMAMVSDPQGAMLYVLNPTAPAGQPNATSDVFAYDKPQHMRWNELQTTDQDAAVALYTDLFGWRQEGAMPMGPLGDYKFFYHGEGMIGAVMPKMPDVPQSAWTFYVGVDDIDRAAKAVTAAGGRHLGPIEQIPGGEFSLHVMDPQGAPIGLVGPRKAS